MPPSTVCSQGTGGGRKQGEAVNRKGVRTGKECEQRRGVNREKGVNREGSSSKEGVHTGRGCEQEWVCEQGMGAKREGRELGGGHEQGG